MASDAAGSSAERLVFIVGAPRSGTTWVRGILAEDPRAVSGAESHLFPVLYGSLIAIGDPDRRRADALAAFDRQAARHEQVAGHRAQGPHRWAERETLERLLDEVEAHGMTGEPAARHVIGGILDDHFGRERGPGSTVLVEKTPRHVKFADRILAWWPTARVIEVVRDGRDVCVSLGHKSKVVSWAPADRAEQIEVWAEAVRQGSELRSSPEASDRWLLVRYEDLSGDPVAEIRRIYEFAGLGADEELITRVAEATAIDRVKQQRPHDDHHVRKGIVGGWRASFSAEDRRRFDASAGELLAELGYEP